MQLACNFLLYVPHASFFTEMCACFLSILRIQKQTVATDALFRRLGREKKETGRMRRGTKEITLQEMKTRL